MPFITVFLLADRLISSRYKTFASSCIFFLYVSLYKSIALKSTCPEDQLVTNTKGQCVFGPLDWVVHIRICLCDSSGSDRDDLVVRSQGGYGFVGNRVKGSKNPKWRPRCRSGMIGPRSHSRRKLCCIIQKLAHAGPRTNLVDMTSSIVMVNYRHPSGNLTTEIPRRRESSYPNRNVKLDGRCWEDARLEDWTSL